MTRMSGPQRLGRGRHARDQPAAADRHDERVERRHVLEHLDRDRSLARHDQRVVVRRDVEQPALGLDEMGVGDGVVERLAHGG